MTNAAAAAPGTLEWLGDDELRRAVAGMVDAGTLTEDTPEYVEMMARVRARRGVHKEGNE